MQNKGRKVVHALIACLCLGSFLAIKPAVVSARVEPWAIVDGRVSGHRPVLVNAAQEAATTRINQAINDYLYRQIVYFKNIGVNNPDFKYIVSYEDDKVLSLVIEGLGVTAGRERSLTVHGLTYDKTTGQRLPRSYFVKLRYMDLNQSVLSSCYNASLALQPRDLRALKTSASSSIDKHSVVNVSNDFFLLGDGGIALIYPYPHTRGRYEFMIVKLVSGQVKYFNWKYR